MIFPFMTIRENVILDRSSWVVEDGAGWEDVIYQVVEEFVRDTKSPNLEMERGKLASGFLAWAVGSWRNCLRLTNGFDNDLRTVVIIISANSHGSSLVVNWWLVTKLGCWRWLLESAGYWLENQSPPTPLSVEFDVFQKEILMKAFVTVGFTALQWAVEDVMQRLGQDTSGLHPNQSGFVI